MKKISQKIIVLAFIVFLSLLSGFVLAEKEPLIHSRQGIKLHSSSSQKSQLEQTIQHYFDGRRNANLGYLKKAFASDARLLFINSQNQLQVINLKEYLAVVKKQGKVKVKTKIEQLEFYNNIAFAKAIFDYESKSYTDFLTLMKIKNQWQIVNKSFVQNKN